MNRIMLAVAAVLVQGAVALGAETGHSAAPEATTPTVGHAPSWLNGLLTLIAAMFAAAIVAGLVWRQPAPEPASADAHGHDAHGHDAHGGGAAHH